MQDDQSLLSPGDDLRDLKLLVLEVRVPLPVHVLQVDLRVDGELDDPQLGFVDGLGEAVEVFLLARQVISVGHALEGPPAGVIRCVLHGEFL